MTQEIKTLTDLSKRNSRIKLNFIIIVIVNLSGKDKVM